MPANIRARSLILLVAAAWMANGVWTFRTGQSLVPVPTLSLNSMNINWTLDSLETVVSRVEPTVVTVASGSSIGSGFVFKSGNYILTNHHVVANHKSILLTLQNGETRRATIVKSDRAVDIAVLRAQGSELPVAAFGDSAKLKPGQTVFAIGSPLNLNGTVTNGIISSLRQTKLLTLIQTNTALNPGNSGGPLFDQSGRIIGINTKIQTIPVRTFKDGSWQDGDQRIPASGIGLAIAINEALKVANHIIQSSQRLSNENPTQQS